MSSNRDKYTGKIICLAFPDTFVKHSSEKVLKLFPYLGLGTKTHIKAGHAALVLVHNQTGELEYFDFGRYITPTGYGRVRSAETDVELEIPFKASFDCNGQIINLKKILIWLQQNPNKTHGSGRLIASVCHYIDYQSAKHYLLSIQAKGNVVYKAFGVEGSNCSRIVTETVLRGTDHPRIRKRLNRNKKFTPSTVGNVEAVALGEVIFEVTEGVVKSYKSTALKENLRNYFDKNFKPVHLDKENFFLNLEKVQYLEGIGSGAYFEIEEIELDSERYKIKRYDDFGKLDFQGTFCAIGKFDIEKPYTFTYNSNCKHCHIIQNNVLIKFQYEKTINSKQKERLV